MTVHAEDDDVDERTEDHDDAAPRKPPMMKRAADSVHEYRGWTILTRAEPTAGRWAPIWTVVRDTRSARSFTEVLPDRTTFPTEAQALAHAAAIAWLYRTGALQDRRRAEPPPELVPSQAIPFVTYGC